MDASGDLNFFKQPAYVPVPLCDVSKQELHVQLQTALRTNGKLCKSN